MTKKPTFLLLCFLGLNLGCDATGPTDAGDPEPSPTPPTCEGEETEWPGGINAENFEFFLDSGCTTMPTTEGSIDINAEMLARADEFSFLANVSNILLRGDFPAGTNLSEISFIENAASLFVSGEGIVSLSGLQITALPKGIELSGARDLVRLGMSSLESVGEVGLRHEGTLGIQMKDLPVLEDFGFSDDFEFVSGKLTLKNLPELPGDLVVPLVDANSAMGDVERGAVIICGIKSANAFGDPCED